MSTDPDADAPPRRDHADDGADLPLPDDDHVGRQPLDPRRRRLDLDHPGPARQGEPPPRRHRPGPARRHRSTARTGRRPSSPSTRRSTTPGPTSAASSTPTPSRWWRSASAGASPTPGSSPRRGGSAARSASPLTPCPAARPSAGTSPRRSPTGFDCVVLENHGVVTAGAEPAKRLRAVRDPGVRRQDRHQGEPARRGPLPDDEEAVHPRPPSMAPPARPQPGRSPSREKELRRQLASSSAGAISSG